GRTQCKLQFESWSALRQHASTSSGPFTAPCSYYYRIFLPWVLFCREILAGPERSKHAGTFGQRRKVYNKVLKTAAHSRVAGHGKPETPTGHVGSYGIDQSAE
ncbi:unnamed protein product, partial [Ectocarpus sp. 12 AP-2014]